MMNTKSFTELLKTRQHMNSESSVYLTSIIDEYPYFQAARAIFLKNLKNNESFKYNSELKKTAAYSTDRTVLFDFITSAVFTKERTEIKEVQQQITERDSIKEPIAIEEELEIGKPISFTQTEGHSFNQWLQISTHKKIVREENEQQNKADIINSFIKQNPKISKVPKDSDRKEVSIIEKQDSYLMTETLAKVYLEQKKYENAIKAYEILSLKYPEKSGFFADQIKRIRILQNK
ncbi:MAG: hypothetical protein ACI9SI_000515 [Polaribacter sp.]|jgi:hypothetical protein